MSVSKEMIELAVIEAISEWVGETDADHLMAAAKAAIAVVRASAVAEPAGRSELASMIAKKMAEPAMQEFAKNIPQLRELRYLPILQSSTAGVSAWWVILPSGKEICVGEDDWNAAIPRPLYAHPAPAAPVPASVQEVLQHALARFECLEDHFEETGDEALRAMSSVDADRMQAALASLPAPEAAPTREEIADPSNVQEVVAAFEHLRKKMRGDTKGEELAAFARVDRAILALKAAPAK